jgi:hypothetical protein
MFDTYISVNTAIPYSQSIGSTVAHVKWSPVANQLKEFADDVIKRIYLLY